MSTIQHTKPYYRSTYDKPYEWFYIESVTLNNERRCTGAIENKFRINPFICRSGGVGHCSEPQFSRCLECCMLMVCAASVLFGIDKCNQELILHWWHAVDLLSLTTVIHNETLTDESSYTTGRVHIKMISTTFFLSSCWSRISSVQ